MSVPYNDSLPPYTIIDSRGDIRCEPVPAFVPPPPPPVLIANPRPHTSQQQVHTPVSEPNFSPPRDIRNRTYLPSSSAPRRPLPIPGQSSARPAPPTRTDTGTTTGSNPRYLAVGSGYSDVPSPDMTPPPSFTASPRQTSQPMDADMPPTPSTSSSGGSRGYQTRQSHLSLHSITSTTSPQSAASFNPLHPPPWAVSQETGGLSQHPTMTPEMLSQAHQQSHIAVNINSTSGHIVTSKHFDVYLDKGTISTIPSYGKGEVVEGHIRLKTLDHIGDIDVTGNLRVTYHAQGVAYDHLDESLFSEKRTAYKQSSGQPAPSHYFSFFFPEFCSGKQTPLPPTWSLSCPGVSAEVVYTLRVDLHRTGFMRKHEKVLVKVEYYPRNAPPAVSMSPGGTRPKKLRWLALEINKNLRPMGNSGLEKPMVPTTLNTRICLLRPKVYASASAIRWEVHLFSPVHTAVQGSLDVQVTLVKTSEVFLHGKRYCKESVISKASHTRRNFLQGSSADNPTTRRPRTADNQHGGTLTIEGIIKPGNAGEEMSWSVDGIASIRYALRFVIAPTATAAEFTGLRDMLPTFEHSEEITLTTHEAYELRSLEHATMPADGLGHNRMRSHTLATTVSTQSSLADEQGFVHVGSYNSQFSMDSSRFDHQQRQQTISNAAGAYPR